MKDIPTTQCDKCGGSGRTIDHVAIGAVMRAKREQAKMSLREVARRLNLSPMFISDLERGRRNWTEERIKQYEKAVTSLLSPAVHVKLDLTKPVPNKRPKAFV